MNSNEKSRRLVALAESDNFRILNAEYEVLSVPERVFRCMWELEADVNNGGFDQYFFNSSGRLVPYVVNALRTIGAVETASIVQRAIDAAGRDIPWHYDDERQDRIVVLSSEIEDQLNKLSEQFFQYHEDLTSLLYKYVALHKEDLRAPTDF